MPGQRQSAHPRGRNRPETIYFLGLTLYCTRNQKGNFKVGMRTEKSRLKRSLVSLQELMRRIRHYGISDQADEINLVLRGHYAYYGVAGNLRSSRKGLQGSGALLAQNAVQPQLGGPTPDVGRLQPNQRTGAVADPKTASPLSGAAGAGSAVNQLPKSVGAGNPHATFCGNRGRATASGLASTEVVEIQRGTECVVAG